MAFVYFLAALVGIVVFALVINRLTGTKASYLETLQLEPAERELWRDARADFATLPRLGQALVTSYPRRGRHTVVWTDRRVIVAQQVLFSKRRMLTHQIVLDAATSPDARKAATQFGGGFYGRGFATIEAAARSFVAVNKRDCLKILPTESSAAALNLAEAYIFSDRLAELRAAVEKA